MAKAPKVETTNAKINFVQGKPHPKVPQQPFLWKTKKGQTLRICDMADHHLINALAMVRPSFTIGDRTLSATKQAFERIRSYWATSPNSSYGETFFFDGMPERQRYCEAVWFEVAFKERNEMAERVAATYQAMSLECTRRGIIVLWSAEDWKNISRPDPVAVMGDAGSGYLW